MDKIYGWYPSRILRRGCKWVLWKHLETTFDERNEQVECTDLYRHRNKETSLDLKKIWISVKIRKTYIPVKTTCLLSYQSVYIL